MSLQRLLKIGVFSLCVLLDGGSTESGKVDRNYKSRVGVNYGEDRRELILEKEEKDNSSVRGIFDYKWGNYLGVRIAWGIVFKRLFSIGIYGKSKK